MNHTHTTMKNTILLATVSVLLPVLAVHQTASAQSNTNNQTSRQTSRKPNQAKEKSSPGQKTSPPTAAAESELPPVRLGNEGGSQPILNHSAVTLAKPVYPRLARMANVSGQVEVKVLIDENGTVVSAVAISGNPLLWAASVEAAKNSLFSPTLLAGAPVKVTGVIQYNFVAEKRSEVKPAPQAAAVHREKDSDVCVQNCPKTTIYSGGVLSGRVVKLAKPEYPSAARLASASGLVVVQVLIDEQGKVIAAHAISGHPLLHDVCVEAAKNSLFTPVVLSGGPTKVSGVIHYNFVAQ